MPQDVTAIKVTPSTGDVCIIVVNWNPPSNVNISLVEQYMVESPSGNHTTTKTAIAVALLIHRCNVGADTLIRIHAIDPRSRNGASSDNNVTELLEVANNSSGSITTEQSPTTRDQCRSFFLLLIHELRVILYVCMVNDCELCVDCAMLIL